MHRSRWTCVVVSVIVMFVGARAAAAGLSPYGGTPLPLPATIAAADFDNGGEGIAYHDTTPGNAGGAYRSTDVDLQASSEGGYTIGWIGAGEWVNYTVSAAAGSYVAAIRVASPAGGGSLHIGFNGPSNVWKTVSVPATGGWQTWTTITVPVTLGAGTQQMTLLFDTAGFNVSRVTVSTASGATSTPFAGSALGLPGLVLAENFDNGGEGVAYHDTTAGNSGGAYRSTDVDLQASSEGGYTIGWIGAGEWVKYSVSVAAAGPYTATLRVASPSGATLHMSFAGSSSVSVPVTVPATGGWQTWTSVSVPVTLPAGPQVMTLSFDTAGVNVENINISASTTSGSTPPPATTGGTWIVNAGGNLQAALTGAQPGDTIVLQAGATFTGNFVLPAKSASSTAYITITSSAPASSLPGATTRMTPAYAGALPKIQSPNNEPAIATQAFAHHYRLQYLELRGNVKGMGDILDFGDGSAAQNSLAMVPHHLIADHLYIHGDPTYGQKRAIGLNSASTSITNSYIAGIMANAQDSQGICGWNGPGPFTIANNYIEAAGENVLFGGADPAIPELVPSDITLTGNYVTKQLAWKGSAWSVKNILEFKNAQRVSVDGNVFEYNWLAGQAGYSIVFTPRNQGGKAPWSVVQHVTFTNNIVRHVSSAINVLGTDNIYPSQPTNDITIRNNVFEDVSAAKYGGDGRLILINGGSGVTVDHNTVLADGSSVVYAGGASAPAFVFTNNILQNNAWAIMGNNASPGNGTIAAFFPASRFQDNVIAAAPASTYPTGNFYPGSLSAVSFVNLTGGNYRLSSSSPYNNAGTDGKDVGADVDAINVAAGTSY